MLIELLRGLVDGTHSESSELLGTIGGFECLLQISLLPCFQPHRMLGHEGCWGLGRASVALTISLTKDSADVDSHSINPITSSLNWLLPSTNLITNDICSLRLTSVVSSAIMEKNFAFRISSVEFLPLVALFYSNPIHSSCLSTKRRMWSALSF